MTTINDGYLEIDLITQARDFYKKGNTEQAYILLFKAEKTNAYQALEILGNLYYNDNDIKEARNAWIQSAILGNSHSMNNLGYIHTHDGNRTEEYKWITRAANSKGACAKIYLAQMYYRDDIPLNAIEWLIKAITVQKWFEVFCVGICDDEDREWIIHIASGGNVNSTVDEALFYIQNEHLNRAYSILLEDADNEDCICGKNNELMQYLINNNIKQARQWILDDEYANLELFNEIYQTAF